MHSTNPQFNNNCVLFQQVAQLQQQLEEAEKQNMTINQEYRKLLAEKQVWWHSVMFFIKMLWW